MTSVSRWSLFVGIDPGQSGGIVAITEHTRKKLGKIETIPMPNTERDIWNVFMDLSGDGCVALIEKVHSMPKQGVSSTFKFGVGYGGLRMALIAAGIPFETVTPQAWQKGLGIPKRKKTDTQSQWKNKLRAEAQQLFPQVDVTLKTADALLIAEFNRRKQLGILG